MNKDIAEIPDDFCYKTYLFLNKDIRIDLKDEKSAIHHYLNHGYKEARKYHFSHIPDDFNSNNYLKLNKDIKGGSFEAKYHYEFHGRHENRKYKVIVCPNYPMDINMKRFLKIYKTTYEEITTNPKMEFRFICFNGIFSIRNIVIPPSILVGSKHEAVLIEYRCFPHLEFIIRTAILKLGKKWSHTIICGNKNYDFMVMLCNKISDKIKIINTQFDNLSPSQYSTLLAGSKFWNLLTGEKILIYQEDSLIFKNNIDDFLHWDYIGAPWPENTNNNKNNVGNGGLSLRSRETMLKIINKININNTKLNKSTIDYMKNSNCTTIPEDVYFSKNMEEFNIGNLADHKSAFLFSTESLYNENSFGGHNFWISSDKWREMIYNNNIISFKPNYDLTFLEHRGGWKSVIEELIGTNFYSENSPYEFFDMLENQFLWNNDIICKKKWSGIIHCTHKTPDYLQIINIENLFLNQNFIESLNNCFLLFTFSSNVTSYLEKKLQYDYFFQIPIYTLKLPVVQNNIPLFQIEKFDANKNKKLIQLGQQLRKVSSIYLVNSNNYEKWWLTGSKNFEKMTEILFNELKYLCIGSESLDISVKMHYTATFQEYDELLSKNIIFIDFFDTAANNAIVECIIRGTPIIVNKIGGVAEYLGEDYPLYFEKLEEVPNLLNIEKIKEAHEYLVKMDKEELSIDFFTKKLNTLLYQNIHLAND
jgi:hypothetical protein